MFRLVSPLKELSSTKTTIKLQAGALFNKSNHPDKKRSYLLFLKKDSCRPIIFILIKFFFRDLWSELKVSVLSSNKSLNRDKMRTLIVKLLGFRQHSGYSIMNLSDEGYASGKPGSI